jgi:hypothetical protein
LPYPTETFLPFIKCIVVTQITHDSVACLGKASQCWYECGWVMTELFKYLEETVTDKNDFYEEIKTKLNSGNTYLSF